MGRKLMFAVPAGVSDAAVRRQIGLQVGEMINACEAEKDNFRERWRQVDRAYRNELEESLERPWPTAPTYHVPILQPRVDRSTAFVAGPLTSSIPWWLVRAGGPASKRIDQVESVLHYHLHRAKYPFHLRQALDLTQLRGKAVLQPYFEGAGGGGQGAGGTRNERRPRLCLRAIDVQDHVVYPNYCSLIDDCLMTGHRYEKPLQWVREQQDLGAFFPDVEVRGGSEIKRGGGDSSLDKNSQGDNATRPEHEAVEIYQVVAKLDPLKTGRAEWYLVELYKDRDAVLRIERYRYSRPWYFDLFIKQEYGRFLNENSRGRNLMGPQFFTNDTVNMQVWGSYYAMLPAVFGQRWALPEDVSAIKPGMVVPMEGGGGVSTVQGSFDPAAFPALTQLGRIMADDVGGVSAQGLGASLRQGNVTATESSNAAAGQMTGIQEDSANVCFGLTEMVEFVVGELLYQHYDEWEPAYRDVLPQTSPEDFAHAYWFEANGQTALNTPQAIQQQLQGLTQLLQVLGPQTVQKIQAAAPNFDMDLVRIALESTTLPGKETLLPTREEMASMEAQQGEMHGPIANPPGDGGLLQLARMGLPPDALGPGVGADPGGAGGVVGPVGPGMGPGLPPGAI
jgi:hypothetical protein